MFVVYIYIIKIKIVFFGVNSHFTWNKINLKNVADIRMCKIQIIYYNNCIYLFEDANTKDNNIYKLNLENKEQGWTKVILKNQNHLVKDILFFSTSYISIFYMYIEYMIFFYIAFFFFF